MFNSWGLVNAYGTFSSFYMESLMPDAPIYLLNLIGSTESFVVLVLSFAVGRLLDAGFSRHLLGVGAVFVSLGMFTLSLSSGSGGRGEGNYALIWVTQGLTQGLGMACFFVASSQSTYLVPNLVNSLLTSSQLRRPGLSVASRLLSVSWLLGQVSVSSGPSSPT